MTTQPNNHISKKPNNHINTLVDLRGSDTCHPLSPPLCSKTLLRWTVLTSDLLLFFPPALALVIYHFRKRDSCQVYALAAILLNPAAILIDHGHFQVTSEDGKGKSWGDPPSSAFIFWAE